MNIKRSIFKGAIWIAASRLFVNLMSFVSTTLVARMLSPDDFGIVAMATAVTATIMAVTDLSLSSALVNRSDPTEDDFHTAWTLSIIRSMMLGVVIVAIAWPISASYKDGRLFEALLAIGLSAILTGLTNPKMIVFTKRLIFWQDFTLKVGERLISMIFTVYLAYEWRTFWALIIGTMAGQVFSASISYAMIPYLPKISFRSSKNLLSYSVWLSLGQAINVLNWKADQFAIGYLFGSSALGYYSMGDNLASLPTREATSPISQTLFPGFALMGDDKARLRTAYERAQAILCVIALPVGIGFALIAPTLIILALGEKWSESIVIIQILSVTFSLQSLSNSLQPLAMATGYTKLLFGRDLRSALIRIPFMAIGILTGGLIGLVWGRFFSSLVGTAWNLTLVKQIIDLSVKRQILGNWRTIIATICMSAIVYFADALIGMSDAHVFLIKKTIILIAIGISSFSISLAAIWLIAGRPAGPEMILFGLLKRFNLRNRR